MKSVAVDGYDGDWSPVVRFVVIPPPSPPLEKPETGEKTIHLKWRPIEGIRDFHLQMARDREFKEVLIDGRVDQASIPSLSQRSRGSTTFVQVAQTPKDTKGNSQCLNVLKLSHRFPQVFKNRM